MIDKLNLVTHALFPIDNAKLQLLPHAIRLIVIYIQIKIFVSVCKRICDFVYLKYRINEEKYPYGIKP